MKIEDDAVQVVSEKIIPVKKSVKCNKCSGEDDGELVNVVDESGSSIVEDGFYLHQCSTCGYECLLSNIYPRIDFEGGECE